MKQETLFTLDTPYRQKLDVEGSASEKGEKSLCIVGLCVATKFSRCTCVANWCSS